MKGRQISQLSTLFDLADQAANLPLQEVRNSNKSGQMRATGAEAARYCVLLRLTPTLKHDMVVDLQAVSMMAEVIDAKLEKKGLPGLAELHKNISKINRLAREAVARCLSVTAWIESVEDKGVVLSTGVDHCVTLLQGNFNFHGFLIRNLVAKNDFEVANDTLRYLLAASLIWLMDTAVEPCDVVVSAELADGFAMLKVQRQPRDGDNEVFPRDAGYRQLEWADLQALALAESVELTRNPDQIEMRMVRMIATTPLLIAPV